MKLLFEESRKGRGNDFLPEISTGDLRPSEKYARKSNLHLPEISEVDIGRHYTNLAKQTHGVNDGFYPLGSCTMKYNPRIDETIASLNGFTDIHPLQPEDTVQGCMEVINEAEGLLCEITGMDAMTFEPAAGAHGEYTGLLLIRKLRTPSKIMLSIFIFLAQCLGTTLDFYNIFPWWDIMLHFSSGILIYFIAIDIILIICKKNKDVKLNKFIICLFAVCFSLAISNLWEIFEFSVDNIFNLDTQKTGELVGKLAIKDTMTDLISSLCSTLLCFVITYFFGSSKIFDYE